jgi:hypothetical protein
LKPVVPFFTWFSSIIMYGMTTSIR